jgi:hypothetical protein
MFCLRTNSSTAPPLWGYGITERSPQGRIVIGGLAADNAFATVARYSERLICVKARVRQCIHKYVMSENPTFTNEVICSICGRPMTLLHTIRRAFAESLNVFKCKPCGFSMTEPVS